MRSPVSRMASGERNAIRSQGFGPGKLTLVGTLEIDFDASHKPKEKESFDIEPVNREGIRYALCPKHDAKVVDIQTLPQSKGGVYSIFLSDFTFRLLAMARQPQSYAKLRGHHDNSRQVGTRTSRAKIARGSEGTANRDEASRTAVRDPREEGGFCQYEGITRQGSLSFRDKLFGKGVVRSAQGG
jgi:hypothetical protein